MRTRVGYCGGSKKSPTYYRLGNHTEAFQVDFDPEKLSYAELVRMFWNGHNPCRQAWSTQYKSAVFVGSESQRKTAEDSRARLEKKLGKIHTEILPLAEFYLAEDYHQKYLLQNHAELIQEFRAIYPKFSDFLNSTAAARVNGYLGGQGTPAQLQEELDQLGLSEKGQKLLRARVR